MSHHSGTPVVLELREVAYRRAARTRSSPT